MVETDREFRSGQVALLGRPNVGKSTLLNALVGEKLSIVTAKPHTTRHRVLGVLNRPEGQAVFIDTPGYTRDPGRMLNRLMARALHQTLGEADLVVLVTEANRPIDADAAVIEEITGSGRPAILVINKMDRLKSRDALLPRIEVLRQYPFLEFVPISARSGKNLAAFEAAIFAHLPKGPPLYPEDFKTDKSERFRATEIIREKLMSALHQEIPYGIAVEIESMQHDDNGLLQIQAIIWIERESQKAIVIGSEGKVLKHVGTAARLELIPLFGERMHLKLWVKVREHWSDDAEELKRLGLDSL
jgi:GTP-binding protein Era